MGDDNQQQQQQQQQQQEPIHNLPVDLVVYLRDRAANLRTDLAMFRETGFHFSSVYRTIDEFAALAELYEGWATEVETLRERQWHKNLM